MTRLKETVGVRIHALQDLGKNLLELLWLLFAAYQWIVAIGLPLALAGGVIGWLRGRGLDLGLYDRSLVSPTGAVLTGVTLAVYAGFAYWYLFGLRRRGEPTFHYKCTLLALYVSVLLMLTWRIELAEHRYVLDHLRYSRTTVRLFDAATQRPLKEAGYLGPPARSRSVLPAKYSTMFSPDGSYTIQLVDIEPMAVRFTAPGYETRRVLVGQEEGDQTLKVFLQQKAEADPNTPAAGKAGR
jgi:hypothetical protein